MTSAADIRLGTANLDREVKEGFLHTVSFKQRLKLTSLHMQYILFLHPGLSFSIRLDEFILILSVTGWLLFRKVF